MHNWYTASILKSNRHTYQTESHVVSTEQGAVVVLHRVCMSFSFASERRNVVRKSQFTKAMMSCRCSWMLKQWQRCWVSLHLRLTSWCMKQISPPWRLATGLLFQRSSSLPGCSGIQREVFSEASEVVKARSDQKLFPSTKWSVPTRSVTGGAGSVFLPTFLRGQKYLSVLAKFQNHWKSDKNE